MSKRIKATGFDALTRRGRADVFDYMFTAGSAIAQADRCIQGAQYEHAARMLRCALTDINAARGLILCHDAPAPPAGEKE